MDTTDTTERTTTPPPSVPFPKTNAGWEDAYHLPRGVIEAIQTCPAPARIAEVISRVRDEALTEAGLPVPGTVGS